MLKKCNLIIISVLSTLLSSCGKANSKTFSILYQVGETIQEDGWTINFLDYYFSDNYLYFITFFDSHEQNRQLFDYDILFGTKTFFVIERTIDKSAFFDKNGFDFLENQQHCDIYHLPYLIDIENLEEKKDSLFPAHVSIYLGFEPSDKRHTRGILEADLDYKVR